MDRTEIVDAATQLIDYYTEKLIFDQFWNFKVEIGDGDFYCETVRDEKSPLCWVIKLNPDEHQDVFDVQYSVVEALLKVLLEPLEGSHNEKSGIIARLTTSLCDMLTDESEDEEDIEEEDYE